MHRLNLSCWELRPEVWPPSLGAAADDEWLLEPHAAIEIVMPTVANAGTYRRTVCVRKGLLLSLLADWLTFLPDISRIAATIARSG
jgi:uncharacterized membrane protein YhhN